MQKNSWLRFLALSFIGIAGSTAAMKPTQIDEQTIRNFLVKAKPLEDYLKKLQPQEIFEIFSPKLEKFAVCDRVVLVDDIKKWYTKVTRSRAHFDIRQHSDVSLNAFGCDDSGKDATRYPFYYLVGLDRHTLMMNDDSIERTLQYLKQNDCTHLNGPNVAYGLFMSCLWHELGHVFHHHHTIMRMTKDVNCWYACEIEADRFSFERVLDTALFDKQFSYKDYIQGAKILFLQMFDKAMQVVIKSLEVAFEKFENKKCTIGALLEELVNVYIMYPLTPEHEKIFFKEHKKSLNAVLNAAEKAESPIKRDTLVTQEDFVHLFENKPIANYLLRIADPGHPTSFERLKMADEYLRKYQENRKTQKELT